MLYLLYVFVFYVLHMKVMDSKYLWRKSGKANKNDGRNSEGGNRRELPSNNNYGWSFWMYTNNCG